MLMRAGRRLAFVALGAAVIALGWASTTPGEARGGGVSISIKAKDRDRVYGSKKATKIVGKVRTGSGGGGGILVQIYANRFPYGNAIPLMTTMTGPGGRYVFKVKPRVNTRYRVASASFPEFRSKQRQVWVYARIRSPRLKVNQRKGVVRGAVLLRYSPDVRPDFYRGNRVYWYFRKLSRSKLKRVKVTRLHKRRGGGVQSKAKYRLPPSRRGYRFEFTWCIKAPARDVGVGDARPGKCPRKIKVRGRQASPRGMTPPPSGPFTGVADSGLSLPSLIATKKPQGG